MKSIQSIVVCGAGTMGSGIAQVAIQAGLKTIQFDLNESALAKSKETIQAQMNRLVEKGKLSEDQKVQILGLLHFTSSIEDCKADLIIEAIIENIEVKIELFKQLAAINDPATILATNTSSISIDAIAAGLAEPSMLVGMHFFNPAPLMKLVEVIAGKYSSPEAIELLMNLTKTMGKVPVLCTDSPGFIVNRVARHYYLEAMEMVSNGLIDIESVDAMMEAAGFKMGPFKLMDLIGMDINFSVSNIVWEALGKPQRLTPSPLQKEKVANGQLGKKTGKGFYNY
ncbi:MAG: 3-hydroxyacyl-CoA dehydrogenase NAD-binding domain-containing protein [Sphingobacteriia bacterium]|jgi:3-hydroxybutyryl-CoA dehydrogenase